LILRAVRGGWLPELPLKQNWKGWYEAIIDLVPDLPETELAPWQARYLQDLKEFRALVPRVGARNYKEKGLNQIPGHRPAPTIRAMGHDGHCHQFNAIVDAKVLRVTPRCYARFQTFPDTFWLPDRPVDAIKGIGNAVPCLLVKAIVEGFVK
jgi:DNA (cytosine-5)-methyltransferase 1